MQMISIKVLVLLSALIALSTQQQCWTCSPGYVHWYDIGMASAPGGDRCACVASPQSPTTTKAPSSPSATYDTRGCWTCSPGYTHWFNAGMASAPGGDRCACVASSGSPPAQTTTRAPSTPTTTKAPSTPSATYDTRGCWTCSPGYTHWFNAGMSSSPGGDRCACVALAPSTTTTRAPTTPTTTKAPAPAPTTTKAPSSPSATYDTRGCWTCSPGFTHWFNAGMASAPGGDRCACVASSGSPPAQTTTRAPSTPTTTKAPASAPTTTTAPSTDDLRGCWTCSPGYSHWWKLNMAEPADRCSCFPTSGSPPSAPSPPSVASPPVSGGGAGWNAGGRYGKYTGQMRRFLNAMTPSGDDTGSVSFSAAVAPYSPWNPPPMDLIKRLLGNIRQQTKFKTLTMYYIDQWTIPVIAEYKFQMMGVVSLVVGQDNTGVINAAIQMANQFPDTIVGIACGNELGQQSGLTWSVVHTITDCVNRVKAAVKQPVGSMDTYSSWCSQDDGGCRTRWSAVSDSLDWIGVNIYPYWNNVFSGDKPCNYYYEAAQRTMESHNVLMDLYSNIPVIVTEWGWPGAPDGQTIMGHANYVTGQQCSVCNNANQKKMVQDMIELNRKYQLPSNCFSAFREEWKGTGGVMSIETQWGICSGTPPYNCMNSPN